MEHMYFLPFFLDGKKTKSSIFQIKQIDEEKSELSSLLQLDHPI
mgnify:CR=1 FL=1